MTAEHDCTHDGLTAAQWAARYQDLAQKLAEYTEAIYNQQRRRRAETTMSYRAIDPATEDVLVEPVGDIDAARSLLDLYCPDGLDSGQAVLQACEVGVWKTLSLSSASSETVDGS